MKPDHRQRIIEWPAAQKAGRGQRVSDIQEWFDDPEVQRRIGELICKVAEGNAR